MTSTITAAFDVELVVTEVRGKSYHHYKVPWTEKLLEGVTGTLAIIHKEALVAWARNEAVKVFERELTNVVHSNGKIKIDEAWIESMCKKARARPKKIMDDAADIGTRAHAYIDARVLGKPLPTLTPDIEPSIRAFEEWVAKNKYRLVMGDTKVASKRYWFGGSLDCLAYKEGAGYYILDWKTTGGIYSSAGAQCGAYALAAEETLLVDGKPIAIAGGEVVRFGKDGTLEHKEVDMLNARRAFIRAKECKDAWAQNMFIEKQETNNDQQGA